MIIILQLQLRLDIVLKNNLQMEKNESLFRGPFKQKVGKY